MESAGFEVVEKELAEYVRRYLKLAFVKATQVAVKSSHSKFAVDIQKLGAQHYEVCVQRCFKAIRETFSEEGILEEMAKLHNLAEEQKQFKDTHLRRPIGIASVDTELLADVINSGLLREEQKILEQLKTEHKTLVDELVSLTSTP